MTQLHAVIMLLLLASCAGAKKKVPPTPLPEFVDRTDGQEALIAKLDLVRAEADWQLKKIAWEKARAKLVEKYKIDPDTGEGWDEQEDGKWKIRRALLPPPPKSKK